MAGRLALRIAVLASLLLLAACAAPTFSPYTVEISDPQKFDADLVLCQGYAAAYPKTLSVQAIGAGTVVGAAQNAAGAAVNPLVPVIGALGGAAQATISGLGAFGTNERKIIISCMIAKGERSGAYLVLEPN